MSQTGASRIQRCRLAPMKSWQRAEKLAPSGPDRDTGRTRKIENEGLNACVLLTDDGPEGY